MTSPSTTTSTTDVTRRHDFVLLFDVRDGNPNGDPDAGNLPRVDPETMQGLVTDGAIKRKVRDYVDMVQGDEERFKIYIQSGSDALNTIHQRAYDDLGLKSTGSKQKREDVDRVRPWMCRNFFDIRTFGAVMTTGVNCGQVRGPMQMTFARSIDRIFPSDHAITRVAVTRPEDAAVVESEEEGGETTGKETEMGRKWDRRAEHLLQAERLRAELECRVAAADAANLVLDGHWALRMKLDDIGFACQAVLVGPQR